MSTSAVNKQNPMTPAKGPSPTATIAPAATAGAAKAAVARKGRKLVDPNETDEQQFKRLTEPRVTKALRVMRQLKNLSRFKPSDAHRDKVFGAIRSALLVAETSWKGVAEKKDEGFSL